MHLPDMTSPNNGYAHTTIPVHRLDLGAMLIGGMFTASLNTKYLLMMQVRGYVLPRHYGTSHYYSRDIAISIPNRQSGQMQNGKNTTHNSIVQ